MLPVAPSALQGDRAGRLSTIGAGFEDLHRVGPDEPALAPDRRDPDSDRLAGERMPDEEHLPLVPGDAVAPVGDRPDLDDDPVPDRHPPDYRGDGPAPISPAT